MEFQGEKRKIGVKENGIWFHEFTIPKQINIFFQSSEFTCTRISNNNN